MTTFTTLPISCHDLAIPSILTYGFLIDGQLDAQRLLDSWDLLVQRWPILSARIRHDGKGSYHYIIPSQFTPEHPPFTHEIRSITETSSKHFNPPHSTPRPSTHLRPDITLFQPPIHLLRPKIVDYASSDPPQPVFHIQLTAFSDKTAIGFTVPHCFTDAGGLREILRAWVLVLQEGDAANVGDINRDTLHMESIVPPNGIDGPPSAWQRYDTPTSPPPPRRNGEGRWVFMPSAELKELKIRCTQQLIGNGDSWVSEGDVLFAWWIKTIYSSETLSPGIPLTITIPMDLRGRLPELSDPSPPLIHNATYATYLTMSIDELDQLSLSDLALRIREVITHTTADEIRHTLAYRTQQSHLPNKDPNPPTPFPPQAERVTLSNWLKMDWGGDWMDLSPASIGPGSGKVVWADISWQAQVGSRSAGMACRRDKNGVWIWFNLADWRWKNGELGSLAVS